MTVRYIISTDLDGTLLDHHDYSWRAAETALKLCATHGVPVIFNTSKTAAESLHLQSLIGLNGPLCVENGSALLMRDETHVFGTARSQILDFLGQCRVQHGWQFAGFNDWSTEEISERTGLARDDAARAADKRFSEPFVWNDTKTNLQRFSDLAQQANLKLTRGGRFFHLQGQCDKSSPLRWLKANASTFFPVAKRDEVELICLGDGDNDIEMLEFADRPICVRSPVHDFPILKTSVSPIHTEAFGPAGWGEAVIKLLTNKHHG